MTLKLERDRWYRMRNGRKVRVICTDAPGDYPVRAVDRHGYDYRHTMAGKFSPYCGETNCDLIAEVRDPTAPPREWTLRLGYGGEACVFDGPSLGYDETVRVREVLDE